MDDVLELKPNMQDLPATSEPNPELISKQNLRIIVPLLASADQIFSQFIQNFAAGFININIGDCLIQMIIIIAISSLVFSFLYSLNRRNSETTCDLPAPAPQLDKGWDPVIVITILICINLIYVLFSFIQFSYLFGSINSVLPFGFSYAEYARRGFFELNFITLINLTLLLTNLRFTKQLTDGTRLTIRILNTLLVICTLVLDISAHFRMSLYEEVYGYTYLRLLTHAFMGVILALLIASIWRVWNEKVRILKAYIIIGLVALTLINYINIDAIITRQNIARYNKTGKIDVAYLNSLSYEAVPELTKLLKDINPEVAEKIEKGLYAKENKILREPDWQSFNLSKYRARQIISKLK